MNQVTRRGRQCGNQHSRFSFDKHLAQHQFAPLTLPSVIQQCGGMCMQHRVPTLDQLELRQLLLCALHLFVDVIRKDRVALGGITTDDKTGFLGAANGRQLEDIDTLVLPGIRDVEVRFLNSVEGHSDRFPWM